MDVLRKVVALFTNGFFLSYVFLIVLFAIIYTSLPGHFVHVTLAREPSFAKLTARAATALATTVFRDTLPSRFLYEEGFYFIMPLVRVGHLRVSDSALEATFLLDVYSDQSRGKRDTVTVQRDNPTYISSVTIECDVLPELLASEPHYPALSWRLGKMDSPLNAEALADFGNWIRTADGYRGFMSMDRYNELVRFVLASRGVPIERGDNFPRMLYFSIATIATVGYGDIVPVTGLARGLAGFEAFLGIILIGLFLNSLARRDRGGDPVLHDRGRSEAEDSIGGASQEREP